MQAKSWEALFQVFVHNGFPKTRITQLLVTYKSVCWSVGQQNNPKSYECIFLKFLGYRYIVKDQGTDDYILVIPWTPEGILTFDFSKDHSQEALIIK